MWRHAYSAFIGFLLSAWSLVIYPNPTDPLFYNTMASAVGLSLLVFLVLATRVAPVQFKHLHWMILPLLLYAGFAILHFAYGRIHYPEIALGHVVYALLAIVFLWIGYILYSDNSSTQSNNNMPIAPFAVASAAVVLTTINALMGFAQYLNYQGNLSHLISAPAQEGRVFANLRQPNQYAFLLVIGCLATAWLQMHRKRISAIVLILLSIHVIAIAMSGSRTGAVLLAILGLWGLFDRQLFIPVRFALIYPLLFYAGTWLALLELSQSSGVTFFGADRLKTHGIYGDFSNARLDVWLDSLYIIRQYWFSGVGINGFAFEHTLGPYSSTATGHFNNAHNLFLHLYAELGVPAATGFFALWCGALYKVRYSIKSKHGRFIWCYLFCMLVYSSVEFPLWYLYFMALTMLALGILTAISDEVHRGFSPTTSPISSPDTFRLSLLSLTLSLSLIGWIILDKSRLTEIFRADEAAGPLKDRVAIAQRGFWTAHQLQYGVVMFTHANQDTASQLREALRLVVTASIDEKLILQYTLVLALLREDHAAAWLAYKLSQKQKEGSAYIALREFLKVRDEPGFLALAANLDKPIANPPPTSFFR